MMRRQTALLGAVVMLMGFLLAGSARAEVDAYGNYVPDPYTNSTTGHTFNNPQSALLDTMIYNNQQRSNLIMNQFVQRSFLEQALGEQETPYQRWMRAMQMQGGLYLAFFALRAILRRRRRARPA